ncbi:hypothetical protein PEC18_39740 [Paucibacter sp. O1-1]|nr:hypothetical protein [Paucibacter sp. O1-1]MDA3831743.1 hypothetical protein [Paucibacter sp. O1-1]
MSDKEILAKVGLVPGLATKDANAQQHKGSVLVAFFNPNIQPPFGEYWHKDLLSQSRR